jgi:uncharacterized protein YjbI with pentapeptide repeats
LLTAIYDRGWAKSQHPTLRGVERDHFVRILEEVALASWHGDGRTTTVAAIEAHCQSSGLAGLLKIFEEGAQTGVTRLLLAFYFRQSGNAPSGDRTFEFTHKSFGEYLTARRIVRGIRLIHQQLTTRKENFDLGWDERQALKYWAELCGPSPMDQYLVVFLRNEIRLNDPALVSQWQKTLCRLIEVVLRQGLPMEQLSLPTYHEATRQARNAEEILLVAVNACAIVTQELSQIKWPTAEAFGNWLSHLRGQRSDGDQFSLCLNSLGFLNLQNSVLVDQDLARAHLNGAHLEQAHLNGAHLNGAHLEQVHLEQVHLNGAHLEQANLNGAHLNGAHLNGAHLEQANLNGAHLNGAHLNGAHLEQANLNGAHLNGAHLNGAHLEQANLDGAHLEGAHLERAHLAGAHLERANLERANLYRANLEGANLEGTNLEGANLEGVNLNYIYWNDKTRWQDAQNLDEATGAPSSLPAD